MLDFEALADKDLELQDTDDEVLPLATSCPREQRRNVRKSKTGVKLPPPGRSINRRMQVLVLHGRQSNESLAAFQLSGLKQAVGKEADFKFLEGEHVWEYQEGFDNHDADPMAVQLSKGRDFKIWFRHSAEDPRDRVDYFKAQDPQVRVTYHGAEEAVDRLLRFVDREGPVDVVLGIFEGSILAHLAIAKLEREGRPIPWRLSVFFGSMPIRDDNLTDPFCKRKVAHPTVHVFGKADEWAFYQRTAAGRIPPEDYYEEAIVMEHPAGHQCPGAGDPTSKAILDRVAAEMRYRCGLQSASPPSVARPPKPPSPPLRNLDNMAPRKLRVLAFCGGHSCTGVIKFQTTQLKLALGKDASEWTYIEGTKDWTYFDGEPIVSDMEKTIAKGAQLKNWYMDTCHVADPATAPALNRHKQFDASTVVEYHDIPEVVQHWRNYIMEHGPFDVCVGFSQGAILLHLLIGHFRLEPPVGREGHPERWIHARHEQEQMPWRCSVFVCGMHIRDKNYFHLFDKKSPHPTVHVFGKADEYYDYARDGFGNKPQEEYYENPLVLTHDQSHEFPTAMPRAKQVNDRVSAEIWRHCGGSPEVP